MGRTRIYLDHAAQAPLLAAARARMTALLAEPLGNPSSPHLEGRAAKDVLEDARTEVATALGCRPREVIFTSGATEAAAIALHGAAYAGATVGRRKLVVSEVEYPAVLDTAQALTSMGLELEVVPVQADGVIDAQEFLGRVTDDTAVAALMLANHETGALQPAAEIAAALRTRRIPFLCDAALAPGRIPVDRAALDADLVLLSGIKCGGPAGTGALVVRRGTTLLPLLHGGVQEERLRPGTENVAAVAAFATALQSALARQPDAAARYDARITTFLDGMAPIEGWRVVSAEAHRVPGVVTLELRDVEGEAAMINMDLEGIAVATGSTCALGSSDPSPGLLAMGLSRKRASSTIRVSVGEGTTEDHMIEAASTLCRIVTRLRALAGR
ncbi:MAG: cysteine desulfurase family protein [Planctomycetota bacterium]|nr:cysteine desulfurase family protein [Planctomycetota bacterium]